MKIKIPLNVKVILDTLHNNGYLCYIVGGSVRDSILGREVNDWDVTTSALPKEVIEIFKQDYKIIETGLQHGTVTVLINGEPIEITTFRIDGEYTDGRHPDNVEYTNNLVEDLSRRDLTINAMAYNESEGLIDPFFGVKDIETKLIRCVGNPYDRLKDDSLRIMRVIRFASQLDFWIDNDTLSAVVELTDLLSNVSIERIQSEFNKILLSLKTKDSYHNIIILLYTTGVLDFISPELSKCFKTEQCNPYHLYNVGIHSMVATKNIEPTLHLRLTMLFHDIAKPLTKTTDDEGIDHFYKHNIEGSELIEKILVRLKYDNDTVNKVKTLILYHDCVIPTNKKSVKKWLNKIGLDMFRDLIKVKYADMYAQSELAIEEKYDSLVELEKILEDVLNAEECFTRKDLAISGKDLIKLGYKQGKELGIILDDVLEVVLDDSTKNNYEDLVNYVLTKYNK